LQIVFDQQLFYSLPRGFPRSASAGQQLWAGLQ
jgi:hypothetical protein